MTHINHSESRHVIEVSAELLAATTKFPLWPNDPFHALAIVQEEVGELAKSVLQFHYEQNKNISIADIRKEAIQSIAMLHRFLNSLDNEQYSWPDCSQHFYEAKIK